MNAIGYSQRAPMLRGSSFGRAVLLAVGCGMAFWAAPGQAQTTQAAAATRTGAATGPATTLPAEPETVTVYPGITNISSVPVSNPQKGWVVYSNGRFPQLSRAASDNSSVIYLRVDWSDLEGEGEGKFNWELIDGHIRDTAALGKKLAFRIMAINPSSRKEHEFPQWVVTGHEDEFYKATIDMEGTLKDLWYPKDPNTSPRWKYACKHLIEALGKRYNNHPNIAFAEVGTIGDWGEQISNYAPTNQMLAQMPWREHLSWYRDAFPDTPLISVAAGQHKMDFAWQDQNGIGRRSDGFCAAPVKEDTTEGAYQDGRVIGASFDTRRPSFLEFPPGVAPDFAGRRFWWGTFWNGVINFGKPTYLAFNNGSYMADQLNQRYPYRLVESGNRAGYHLVMERAIYSPSLLAGGTGQVSVTFRNDGCRYPDYPIYVAAALLDEQGNVLQKVWLDTVNLKDNVAPWVAYEMQDTFSGRFVPALPKTYVVTTTLNFTPDKQSRHLALGFFTDKAALKPDIKLGITGANANGWYAVDQYSTTAQTDPYPALHNLSFRKMAMVSGTAEGSTELLTDGNATTRWRSPAKPGQWVTIDLGGVTTFSSIMLDWDEAFPKSYRVEASSNGAAWTELCQTHNAKGGIDYLSVPNTQARFVRLVGNDEQGLSLNDFEVLGSTPQSRPRRRRW